MIKIKDQTTIGLCTTQYSFLVDEIVSRLKRANSTHTHTLTAIVNPCKCRELRFINCWCEWALSTLYVKRLKLKRSTTGRRWCRQIKNEMKMEKEKKKRECVPIKWWYRLSMGMYSQLAWYMCLVCFWIDDVSLSFGKFLYIGSAGDRLISFSFMMRNQGGRRANACVQTILTWLIAVIFFFSTEYWMLVRVRGVAWNLE